MRPQEPQLFCIDITGVVVSPEPMGDGWQCHVEGDTKRWSRGDTIDEAVGGLIRRLAVEHEGANHRRRLRLDVINASGRVVRP